MAAEFAIYSLMTGPDFAPLYVGRIYAEGRLTPIVFHGKSEASLNEEMRAFWDAEVEKMHGSALAREERIAKAAAARLLRKAKKDAA